MASTAAQATELKVAILVVSTTAAADPKTDATTAILTDVFKEPGAASWNVVSSEIVSDDVPQIQRQIQQWTDDPDNHVHLVVTTGGTGFAVSDCTPEAVSPLLSKTAPGLVHAMMASSLAVTPFAMMSRPVAGVRNGTVIITLPGSPKGAKENLQAVIKTLPHACQQAAGSNSRALHAGGVEKLEADAGVKGAPPPAAQPSSSHSCVHHRHHHHSHGHSSGHGHHGPVRHTTASTENPDIKSNDPSLGPSRRHRSSPYPMVSVDEALQLIAQHVPPPTPTSLPVGPSLVGTTLSSDIFSTEPLPAFRASIVDGYAVVAPPSGDMRGIFPVVSVSHAAPSAPSAPSAPLQQGQIARITTGAPLPPGATAVIMVEDTTLHSADPTTNEETHVEIHATGVRPGDNIREIGSDLPANSLILSSGTPITSVGGEIGLLAASSLPIVPVYKPPTIGILSTGDELVEHNTPPPLRHGSVRDTNRPSLLAAASTHGFVTLDLGIAPDTPEALEATLRSALSKCDVLVTTGGVSMGELDLLKPTVERALGGTIHFGRVNMKPGKPTTFATVFVKDTDGGDDGQRKKKVVFGLPGNPASALVTFHLFVLPALHRMGGRTTTAKGGPGLPRVKVRLAHGVSLDAARPEFHRAVVSVGGDGVLVAASTGFQRSSAVSSMSGANALLCLPAGKEPLREGDMVEALLMGQVRAESYSG